MRSRPRGDAAVRRRAVGERVEEEAEALAGLFIREAKGLEQARLDILAMNSDAAGAELVAVRTRFVALRAAFPWSRFEFVEILFQQ